MPRPLGAIFFDVDDTLYSTTEFTRIARGNAVRAMVRAGLKFGEEDLLRELNEVIGEFSSNYEYHFDKLILRLPAETYVGVNPMVIIAAGVAAYHDTKFRDLTPYEDALSVLKILREKKDLILGVISTGIPLKQAEKLIRLGVYEYMNPDAIVISDQIGVSKSNPKLYLRACQSVNVKPGEAMHVGDNPLRDIDPPNRVGMITVLNKRSGKYAGALGETAPRYVIQNFWDLLDILKRDFGF